MVFSSNLFIFAFLPIFLALYFLLPWRAENTLLLLASLLFYEFGAGAVVVVLAASILLNYAAARMLEATAGGPRRAIFWLAVAVNLAALFYYKYAGFAFAAANDFLGNRLAAQGFTPPQVVLPVGISFFTFQALSYLADVYTGHCRAARSLVAFGTYHSLFPQLIAGPIVRYAEIEDEIASRRLTMAQAADGLSRFAVGLARKVIIADHAGAIANGIFALASDQLTPALAWLGTLAYTVQIYFDFAGYSDMAIGLALLLGFHFPENFDAPYRARSVTEFWRRWHMTLSRWFRDYVYVPLGGNRRGAGRTYANLLIVFVLCGLWHGAGYTFLVWGLLHGALLIGERVALRVWGWAPRGLAGQAYTLLAVAVAWVFFRAGSLSQAMDFLGQMTFLADRTGARPAVANFLPMDQAAFLALGVLLALLPEVRVARADLRGLAVRRFATLALFVYGVMLLSTTTFSPFLYFRF